MSRTNRFKMPGVDVSAEPDIACGCGSVHWVDTVRVRKVSMILSASGRDEMATLREVRCLNCGGPWMNDSNSEVTTDA